MLPGDGLDRNGEIDPVNQCDTPNLGFRRAKPGTIHDIPDDFIKVKKFCFTTVVLIQNKQNNLVNVVLSYYPNSNAC